MNKVKYIVSVLAVAFLVYIFTFYMDGEMGMILSAFVVIAPLVSLGFTIYARKNIKISFDCDAYVQKGQKLKITATVEKKNMIPFPIIEIKPYVSPVFVQHDKVYRLSMLNEEKKSFSFEVDAAVGGNGEIGIESVCSCGFLGFIHLKVSEGIQPPVLVGIIPEVPDVKASSSLVRSVANIVATSDNDEENDTSMLYSSNTAPGYEHREYVQGDPLKRVNWKLSSKKNCLMVRLDEAVASVQPVVVLDLFRSSSSTVENAIRLEERILSSTFGLLNALIMHGIACTFIYQGSMGEAVSENVDDPDYIAQLLLKVIAVKIEPDKRIDIRNVTNSACACIIATTDADEGFASVAEAAGSCENITIIGDSVRSVNSTSYPLWYLDDDNNFKLV